MRFYVLDLSN